MRVRVRIIRLRGNSSRAMINRFLIFELLAFDEMMDVEDVWACGVGFGWMV